MTVIIDNKEYTNGQSYVELEAKTQTTTNATELAFYRKTACLMVKTAVHCGAPY